MGYMYPMGRIHKTMPRSFVFVGFARSGFYQPVFSVPSFLGDLRSHSALRASYLFSLAQRFALSHEATPMRLPCQETPRALVHPICAGAPLTLWIAGFRARASFDQEAA